MGAFFNLAFYGLCVVCVLYVLIPYLQGKRELMTVGAFFIAGMAFFQFFNAPPALANTLSETYRISDSETVGLFYLFWCLLFLAVFVVAYQLGAPATTLSRALIQVPSHVISDRALWFVVPVLAGVGLGLKFGVRIPYVGALANFVAYSATASAAGLSVWLLVRNLTNPAAWALALPVTGVMAWAISYGEFSRRPLLNVMFCLIWAAYYSRYRWMPPVQLLPRLVVLGVVGLLAVSLFSGGGRDIRGVLMITDREAVADSLEMTTETYATAAMSVWLIERNLFEDADFRLQPLQSITYMIYMPLPRQFWFNLFGIDKPWTVSTYMADWSGRQGVKLGRSGNTNPAGLIGNAAAEGVTHDVFGATVALVLYAIWYTWIIRFFEEAGRRATYEPLVIVPVGSMMGQVFGIPRGESAVFAFSFIFGTFVCLQAMLRVHRFLAKLGYLEQDQQATDEYGEAYSDEYADYGVEEHLEFRHEDDAEHAGSAR